MRRFLHLNESELRGVIRQIVEEVEDDEKHRGRKSSFVICSEDFEDFDSILNIIEKLGGKCEEQSNGVYLVKCKKGETTDIRTVVKSLSKKHMLDDDDFFGKRTCKKSDFPDDWSDNFEWQEMGRLANFSWSEGRDD